MPTPRKWMRTVRQAEVCRDLPRALQCVLLGIACLAAARPLPAYGEPPLSSIRDLLHSHHSSSDVLLRGTVTYNGRELVMQDGTGALAVDAPSAAAVALGDEIEVRGSLELRPDIPIVRHATVRQLWPGSTPLPLSITPDEAAEGAYSGMLVATEGRLIKLVSGPRGAVRLTMDSGNQLFTCVLEAHTPPEPLNLDIGSTVRCTGVLSVDQAEDAPEAGTFLVLLRNTTDAHLLAGGPWWTPRHLVALFIALLAMSWLGYRIHMRNVRGRLSMVVEERLRIAREIHDTLAQGFAGIALQLQGVARTMGDQSAATEAHLAMALKMVRRSRAEAHRSIATLRTLHSYEDLAMMCERLLRQLTLPAQLDLSVVKRGVARKLSDEVTSQILRITQEAIANVVEHAASRSVVVTITYTATAISVTIEDDGKGFNLDEVRSLESGHFGITGMQERAAGIGAQLAIRSGAEGTHLHLHLAQPEKVKRRTQVMKRWHRPATRPQAKLREGSTT